MSEEKKKKTIDRRTWQEFKDNKLLWWINRILHTFGWAIVLTQEADGTISEVYPAKVTFRGFPEVSEEAGYEGIAKLIKDDTDDAA